MSDTSLIVQDNLVRRAWLGFVSRGQVPASEALARHRVPSVASLSELAADWKGLTRLEELRLLSAAQALQVHPGTCTDQGLRNHALLAVLLGSGLRVSEVLNLDRDQYTGRQFIKVVGKGSFVRDAVAMHRDARQVLGDWLASRGDDIPTLFITRSGRRLSRREAAAVIRRIAAQANAHLAAEEKIDVSPHVLRHTFLRKLAERACSMPMRPPGIRVTGISGSTSSRTARP